MNGPYAEEFWKATQIEIETLERINAWTVVPHTDDITNVLPSAWAFKVKRYPDGTVKKIKGHFCAHGDKQIQGVCWITWVNVTRREMYGLKEYQKGAYLCHLE